MANRIGVSQAIVAGALGVVAIGGLTGPVALSTAGALLAVNWKPLTEKVTSFTQRVIDWIGKASSSATSTVSTGPAALLADQQEQLRSALGEYQTVLQELGIDVTKQINDLAQAARIGEVEGCPVGEGLAGLTIAGINPFAPREELLWNGIQNLARDMGINEGVLNVLNEAIWVGKAALAATSTVSTGAAAPVAAPAPVAPLSRQEQLRLALGEYQTVLRERGIDVATQINDLAHAAGIGAVNACPVREGLAGLTIAGVNPFATREELLRTEIAALAGDMNVNTAALDGAILASWEAPRLPKADPRVALFHLLAARPDTRATLIHKLSEATAPRAEPAAGLSGCMPVGGVAPVTEAALSPIFNDPALSPSYKAHAYGLIGRILDQDTIKETERLIYADDLQGCSFFTNKGMIDLPGQNIAETPRLPEIVHFARNWATFADMDYAELSDSPIASSESPVCVYSPPGTKLGPGPREINGRLLSAFITGDSATGQPVICYRQPITERCYECKVGQKPVEIEEETFLAGAQEAAIVILDPVPAAAAAAALPAQAAALPEPAAAAAPRRLTAAEAVRQYLRA